MAISQHYILFKQHLHLKKPVLWNSHIPFAHLYLFMIPVHRFGNQTMSYTDKQYLEGIREFSIVSYTTNIWKCAEEPVQERPPASAAHHNFRAVDIMISAPTNCTGCGRLVGTAKHHISLMSILPWVLAPRHPVRWLMALLLEVLPLDWK